MEVKNALKACFEFLHSDAGNLLRADCLSWKQWRHQDSDILEEIFERNFRAYPEFRSLVDYRMGRRNRGVFPSLARATDLYISTPAVGPGFRIQHGHSTWVLAREIGVNFHVNQNVTIGMARGGKPKIGDNVSIHTGAVVVGDICVGDNVVIAPNAFVNFDVPSNCSVFPARSVIVPNK